MYICGMKRIFQELLLLSALLSPLTLQAQETPAKAIPDSVYYLMPHFADGYVYLRGQMPAQGKLNICAVNNSLRYIGNDGVELEAADPDAIVKVIIDTVAFIHYEHVFYRMYPVSQDMGVALERKVRIIRDQKETGYGGKSQTAAVREMGSIYAEGMVFQLNEDKVYPYDVLEEISLYKGNLVFSLSKRNLKKLFPDKKADIDAWFKSGHPLPKTIEDTRALLLQFSR